MSGLANSLKKGKGLMCFNSESRIMRAAKNITCWKVARLIDPTGNSSLKSKETSPLRIVSLYKHIGVNVTVVGGKRKASCFPTMKASTKEGDHYHYNISGGGFHAFLSKKGAIAQRKKSCLRGRRIILLKCVVPKGTRYISGKTNRFEGLRSEYMIQGVA